MTDNLCYDIKKFLTPAINELDTINAIFNNNSFGKKLALTKEKVDKCKARFWERTIKTEVNTLFKQYEEKYKEYEKKYKEYEENKIKQKTEYELINKVFDATTKDEKLKNEVENTEIIDVNLKKILSFYIKLFNDKSRDKHNHNLLIQYYDTFNEQSDIEKKDYITKYKTRSLALILPKQTFQNGLGWVKLVWRYKIN